MKRIIAAIVVSGALVLTLSGCAETKDSNEIPQGLIVGDNPATWTPISISIDDNNQTLRMSPNQVAVIDGVTESELLGIEVQTSDPEVVEAIQPSFGESTGNAGFIAKSSGVASIAVVEANGELDSQGLPRTILSVTVIVEPTQNDGIQDSTIMGRDPSSWAPMLVEQDRESVNLLVGQTAAFPDYENGDYMITTSDPTVLAVISPDNSNVASFTAKKSGSAEVAISKKSFNDGTEKIIQTLQVTVE